MLDEEAKIFIAEIRRDIFYIKEQLDDKCRRYDTHLEEGVNVRERLKDVEKDVSWLKDIWWKIMVAGVLTALISSFVARMVIK